MQAAGDAGASTGYDRRGLIGGVRAAASLAGTVMAASFCGFEALLRSLDFDLLVGLAMIPLMWALPGQVVFVDSFSKGLGLFTIALAASVTAVRLMPPTVLVLSQTRRRWSC
ncbi:MAG TPA: hypothetical protein VH933_13955 [Aestuariivirgaceae bacterium]|jgi:hypothetical protein